MATQRVLIGTEDPKRKVEFEDPARTVYLYFGKAEDASFGAGVCHVPPHSSNERHTHDDADEIIYVITGSLRFVFPDEEHTLSQGEAIYIPIGVEHQIFNPTDEIASHTFTFTPAGPEIAIERKYQ